MAHHSASAQVSSIAPRLEVRASGRYIDLRFSRRSQDSRASSQDYTVSEFEGYDSDDFIDMSFPRDQEHDTRNIQEPVEEPHAVQTHHQPSTMSASEADHERAAGPEELMVDFKEMRFPRVSESTLKVDIEDFYDGTTVGLDSLQRLTDSDFLTDDFLQSSMNVLQSMDSDARNLLEKLADLRRPQSLEFCEAVAEYNVVSRKILDVCNALKFTTTLLKAYQNSQVETAVVELEAFVSLSASGAARRTLHVQKAKQAARFIDSCRTEMAQMQAQVKKLVESGSYGSLSNFVTNLNLTNAEANFAKWSGLRGVLFAMKTAASYICQLLLAAFADGGQGPALFASAHMASFNSGWASSLMNLHNHARKQFNKMKENSRCTCTFMSRDSERLEFMLADTKGHLQSLLDQGKFLNMGVYIGSWEADRKNLAHNVPLLRQHLLLVRYRLAKVTESLESLASNMVEGQRYLAHL